MSLYSANPKKELPRLAPAKTPLEAARNGYEYYKHLQAHDGHWPGEYGGPMFLIPGITIGSYVTGVPFTDEERLEMIRYLMNHANEDGGWGMYVAHHFSTRLFAQTQFQSHRGAFYCLWDFFELLCHPYPRYEC